MLDHKIHLDLIVILILQGVIDLNIGMYRFTFSYFNYLFIYKNNFRNMNSTFTENQEMWLEIGSASLGPFILELASSLSDSDKNLHIVQHKYDCSS